MSCVEKGSLLFTPTPEIILIPFTDHYRSFREDEISAIYQNSKHLSQDPERFCAIKDKLNFFDDSDILFHTVNKEKALKYTFEDQLYCIYKTKNLRRSCESLKNSFT